MHNKKYRNIIHIKLVHNPPVVESLAIKPESVYLSIYPLSVCLSVLVEMWELGAGAHRIPEWMVELTPTTCSPLSHAFSIYSIRDGAKKCT